MNHRRQPLKEHQHRRKLRVELLEDRRILDAAGAGSVIAEPLVDTPWQNPAFPLDVTDDGGVNSSDMLAIINRILDSGIGPLDPPGGEVPAYYDTDGNNRINSSDLLGVINGLLSRPLVETTMLTAFTVDVTPQVTVKTVAGATGSLPDGTVVYLDVDLNNDLDFNDPGETGYTQSTLYQGESHFNLDPALPRSTELYTVRLQARVRDTRALQGTSEALPLVVDTLTSDALENYVYAADPSYEWTIRNGSGQKSFVPGLGSYTYYAIDMISQTWRSSDDVNLPVWRHWLTIYVPDGPISNSAMLLIDGGSNHNFNQIPEQIELFGTTSLLLNSTIVHLSVVPNEPVVFTDETISRTEDAIIAYSFDKFLENIGEPQNDTWPVLVAMVKSAARAMDTAQALIPQVTFGGSINEFIVTGYSKRGWTTWLTAAVDSRVRAILPGVFDNLNQGPQMVHHYGAYGFFSEAVHDYNDMEIFHRILTPEAMHLSRIIDPYTYLNNGRFDDMPKLIINSAGDEFFNSDSAQYYWDDVPGDQNYLIYLPNTGHGLDFDFELQESKVASATVTFIDAVINNHVLPEYSWTVGQDGTIRVETDTQPEEVKLWQVTNPVARDFRRALHPDLTWTETTLNSVVPGQYVYEGNVAMPTDGATAYFIELTFPNNNGGDLPIISDPYVFTTEIRVKTELPMYPWPFESAFETLPLAAEAFAAPLVSAAPEASRSAVASALAMERSANAEDEDALAAPALLPAAELIESQIEVKPLAVLEPADDRELAMALAIDEGIAAVNLDTALEELLA